MLWESVWIAIFSDSVAWSHSCADVPCSLQGRVGATRPSRPPGPDPAEPSVRPTCLTDPGAGMGAHETGIPSPFRTLASGRAVRRRWRHPGLVFLSGLLLLGYISFLQPSGQCQPDLLRRSGRDSADGSGEDIRVRRRINWPKSLL